MAASARGCARNPKGSWGTRAAFCLPCGGLTAPSGCPPPHRWRSGGHGPTLSPAPIDARACGARRCPGFIPVRLLRSIRMEGLIRLWRLILSVYVGLGRRCTARGQGRSTSPRMSECVGEGVGERGTCGCAPARAGCGSTAGSASEHFRHPCRPMPPRTKQRPSARSLAWGRTSIIRLATTPRQLK
jgi:hypothetical protein